PPRWERRAPRREVGGWRPGRRRAPWPAAGTTRRPGPGRRRRPARRRGRSSPRPGHRTAAPGDEVGHRRDGTGLGTHFPGPNRGLEDAGGEVDAGVDQGVEELRPQPGRLDLADLAAVVRDPGHVAEQLLEQDDVALEALDLLDGDDAADPVRRPLELDDDVDGRGDLLPDGP